MLYQMAPSHHINNLMLELEIMKIPTFTRSHLFSPLITKHLSFTEEESKFVCLSVFSLVESVHFVHVGQIKTAVSLFAFCQGLETCCTN